MQTVVRSVWRTQRSSLIRFTCPVLFFASCVMMAECQVPGITPSRGISSVSAKWTRALFTSLYVLRSAQAGAHDWSVDLVVRATCQMFQDDRDHPPRVFAIRGAHPSLHLLLRGRPRRLLFFDQITECLLWHDGKALGANGAIRLINGGACKASVNCVCAGFAPDRRRHSTVPPMPAPIRHRLAILRERMEISTRGALPFVRTKEDRDHAGLSVARWALCGVRSLVGVRDNPSPVPGTARRPA